jgi:hypothetical protein
MQSTNTLPLKKNLQTVPPVQSMWILLDRFDCAEVLSGHAYWDGCESIYYPGLERPNTVRVLSKNGVLEETLSSELGFPIFGLKDGKMVQVN